MQNHAIEFSYRRICVREVDRTIRDDIGCHRLPIGRIESGGRLDDCNLSIHAAEAQLERAVRLMQEISNVRQLADENGSLIANRDEL